MLTDIWKRLFTNKRSQKEINKRFLCFLDYNVFNNHRCDIWAMYAIFDEPYLKGELSRCLEEDLNSVLLFTTEKFLEGWQCDKTN